MSVCYILRCPTWRLSSLRQHGSARWYLMDEGVGGGVGVGWGEGGSSIPCTGMHRSAALGHPSSPYLLSFPSQHPLPPPWWSWLLLLVSLIIQKCERQHNRTLGVLPGEICVEAEWWSSANRWSIYVLYCTGCNIL